MKKIIVLLIMLTISTNSFAQNAVLLEKDQKAPFSGTLVKNERLDKLVKAEKKNIVLSDLRIAQDELIDYHKADAKRQRKRLSEAKFEAFWTNAGYFLLGCVLTSVSFKIAQEVQ